MTEAARERLNKVAEAIEAGEYLLAGGFVDIAAGRAYYGMFYIAEALLRERKIGFGKHSAVHAAFGCEFAKPALIDPKYHRWLLNAFERRAEGDYGGRDALDRTVVIEMIAQAREFLGAARGYLYSMRRAGGQDEV
ncbi:MAG: HEPN domain-containing protein [Gemmatimonadetes bacterium]|nr:HEPN domain-containing protein [Gemmatimonadota bacterium]